MKKFLISLFILAGLLALSSAPMAQIPGTSISGLPNASPFYIQNGDYIPITRNGVTYKATPWAFPTAGNIILSSGTGIGMTSLAETDGYCVTGVAGAWSVQPCVTGAAIYGTPSSGNLAAFITSSSIGATDLTGDVTTSGSAATTLKTVNTNTGSFGSSTAIPNFTVNGKGLITAAGTNSVVAPAGTLTGTTLNSTVVTSSLTGVGALTSGSAGSGFTVGAAAMPALTGDITTSAGAVATTLATVNSNTGSFTNANITVNGKGLITAAANGDAGMKLIANSTISSSTASVSFTSGITSTYSHYIMECSNLTSVTNGVDALVTFQQNGSFVSANYYSSAIASLGSTVTAHSDSNASSINVTGGTTKISSAGGTDSIVRVEFWNPDATTGPSVMFNAMSNPTTTTTAPATVWGGGYINQSTYATTGIKMIMSTGNIATAYCNLYGM